MRKPLYRNLTRNKLFAQLEEGLLQQLEPGLELVNLVAGATLVQQGEAGDALYVLLEGQLEVLVRTAAGSNVAVDILTPGASVGEMALVAGQDRTATVIAGTAAKLVRLSRQDFERLADQNPSLREAVVRQMAPRLQRIQLSGVLEQWFADLSPHELHELQEAVTWVQVSGGQPLYRHGDQADGMYLLVSGRLRILANSPEGKDVPAGEIGRGASIGEYAVLGDAPRSETVIAIRDSHLVRFDRDLVARHPQIMAQIARNAFARAQSGGRTKAGNSNGVRTLTLVPAHTGAPVAEVAHVLQQQLETWGRVLIINASGVDAKFGRSGVAQTDRGAPLEPALSYWLNEAEAAHDYTILLADEDLTAWTRRCLGQADTVLMVADSTASHQPGAVELELDVRAAGSSQLILVQPDDTVRPAGTARWLDVRLPLEHHHLRLGLPADAGRLARRLTGRAIGMVLSGGGARGYVHLGLVRALQELEIPIDMVAGTSMGALVGGGYSYSLEFEFCYAAALTFGDPKKLLDKTLPLVALAQSRKVTEMFKSMFGETLIEDLWIPFSCVSANLTRAEPVVHARGLLWQAVRASTAIPGVFTPVVYDGDVLVDGGIMNNYPVDIMRDRVGTGQVIGSNAESATRNQAFDFGTSISGWRVLLERLLPVHRRKRYPSILGTLMRATSVSSKHLGAVADALADVVIRYPVQGFGNLDFDKFAELTKIGYEAAVEGLVPWQSTRHQGCTEPLGATHSDAGTSSPVAAGGSR